MPLSINVGLSRKASKDYQSTGHSINVTAELDQSLLARPAELQQQIGALYTQAQEALDRQAGAPAQVAAPDAHRPLAPAPPNSNGRNGNGQAGVWVTRATQSQRRAIQAICRRIGSDPDYESQQLLGVGFVELSLKQASELIDSLKSVVPADLGRKDGAR